MYQTHHQISYATVSYHPNPPDPASNPQPHFSFLSPLPHPQPDPFSNSDPYPTYSTGFEPQQAYHHDPHGVSPSWVVKQVAPVNYMPAIQPVNQEPFASSSYDSFLNSKIMAQKSVSAVSTKKVKLRKANVKKTFSGQKVRCELCKIECPDLQLYEKHLSGKLHSKNIRKQYASALPASQSINERFTSGGMVTPCGQARVGVTSASPDLETKRQKLLEGGTAVQSLRVCTICNVACNGETAFADHLSGKKHVAKEQALCKAANLEPASTVNSMTPSLEKTTKQTVNSGSAWCDLCKIGCTSQDGLATHRQGKKHKKSLEKLLKQNQPVTASHISVSSDGRSKEPEDVETKKRKVLEGGAAEHAIRTCTICDVVCNSETVFQFHVAGQKHKHAVKLAQAGITNVQQPITT